MPQVVEHESPPRLLNKARLEKARRWSGYVFWNSAALSLPLAVDRLIVCPVLNYYLGEEVFAGYLWVLGIVTVAMSASSNGFSIPLFRDLASRSPQETTRLVRTACTLTVVVTAAIMLLAIAGSLLVAPEVVRRYAWAIYLPLTGWGCLRGLQSIPLTSLRVRRWFGTIFLIGMAETIALTVNVFAGPTRNLWLIGSVYTLSGAVAVGLYVTLTPEMRGGGGGWWDTPSRRLLSASWLAGAFLTLTEQGQVHASRLLVGVLGKDVSDVTTLFAAASIGNLFVVPVGFVGMLVLSMLAGHRHYALRGRRGFVYLAVSASSGLAVGGLSYLLGQPIIQALYPRLANEALSLYGWIAVSNAFSAAMLLLRPVAIRYAPMRQVVGLSAATLAVQLLGLIVLTPVAGVRGAAASLAASSAAGAILWTAAFRRVQTGSRREMLPVEDGEMPTGLDETGG